MDIGSPLRSRSFLLLVVLSLTWVDHLKIIFQNSSHVKIQTSCLSVCPSVYLSVVLSVYSLGNMLSVRIFPGHGFVCLSVCLYVYLFTGIQAISKNLPVTWISQSCLSICLFIVILHIVRIFQGHGFVFLLVHLFILIHAISKKLPRTQISRSPDLRRL